MRSSLIAGYRRAALLFLITGALAPTVPANGAEIEDAVPEGPRELLRRAFDKRYECDTRQTMTLHLRSKGREVQRQRIEVVTKIIDGRLRALARFLHPPDLRNTALLMIEQEGRPDDYFLFLPVLGRVRRVSGAQRSDSFMGSDLSYEDLERRRVEDFDDFRIGREVLAEEPVLVVSARPRRASGYDRVEFAIAARDAALLETRYFRAAFADAIKVIRFPREEFHEENGVVIPTSILVQNFRQRTETKVVVDEVAINPEIDDRLFTTDALQRESDLPDFRDAPR